MKQIIFILLITGLLACNEDTKEPEFNGVWIESVTGDRITFSNDGKTFEFVRGSESASGANIPGSGSGLYEYKFDGDGISLRWTLSSNSAFHTYYFNQMDGTIEMSSFYDLTMSRLLIFEKQ
ncbi:MAG: hypothetical protein RIC35_09050 [Marinoscillum sp.]